MRLLQRSAATSVARRGLRSDGSSALALAGALLAAALSAACGDHAAPPPSVSLSASPRAQLRVDVPNGPATVVVAPSATQLYIGTYRDAEVLTIDTKSGVILRRTPLAGDGAVTATAISDDGRWLFAATTGGHLVKIDASAGTVVRDRVIGVAPFALAAFGTDELLLTDPTSTSLRVVGMSALDDIRSIDLRAHPLDVDVDDASQRAFVTVQDGAATPAGGLVVVDLNRSEVTERQPLERSTRIAYDSSGKQLVVIQRAMTNIPAGTRTDGAVIFADAQSFAVRHRVTLSNPSSLAIDSASGTIFIGDERSGVIFFRPGAQSSQPLPNVGRPTALGASALAGYAFVADREGRTVVLAPFDPR